MPGVEANYLHDFVILLVEAARKAARDKDAARAAADQGQMDYEVGHVMAYYEVITLLQEQAIVFGLDPSWMGLDAIDADRELL